MAANTADRRQADPRGAFVAVIQHDYFEGPTVHFFEDCEQSARVMTRWARSRCLPDCVSLWRRVGARRWDCLVSD